MAYHNFNNTLSSDFSDANNSNMLPKYTYKLNAVIVHRGSHNDGHFMTYRRGCPNVPGDSNASKRLVSKTFDLK